MAAQVGSNGQNRPRVWTAFHLPSTPSPDAPAPPRVFTAFRAADGGLRGPVEILPAPQELAGRCTRHEHAGARVLVLLDAGTPRPPGGVVHCCAVRVERRTVSARRVAVSSLYIGELRVHRVAACRGPRSSYYTVPPWPCRFGPPPSVIFYSCMQRAEKRSSTWSVDGGTAPFSEEAATMGSPSPSPGSRRHRLHHRQPRHHDDALARAVLVDRGDHADVPASPLGALLPGAGVVSGDLEEPRAGPRDAARRARINTRFIALVATHDPRASRCV
jgi:hypothetical protein